MPKKDWMFIISRSPQSAASRYRLSGKTILLAQAALVAFLSFFVLSSLHYLYLWRTSLQHDQLLQESSQLRKENRSFETVVQRLKEKVSSLELTSHKISIFSGVADQGLGGVGGPLDPGASLLLADQEVVLTDHFRWLEERSAQVEWSFRRLLEFYKTRAILRSATPAIMPVSGHPSDSFGYRIDPFTGERDFHPGLDIAAPYGQKVTATADGMVVYAGRKLGYGKLVKIEHQFAVATLYGHLSTIAVRAGQIVRRGDIVGYVGSTGRATGPHLHYEVRLDGHPLNPLRFLSEQSAQNPLGRF